MREFQLNEVRCDVTKGLPRSELALKAALFLVAIGDVAISG